MLLRRPVVFKSAELPAVQMPVLKLLKRLNFQFLSLLGDIFMDEGEIWSEKCSVGVWYPKSVNFMKFGNVTAL